MPLNGVVVKDDSDDDDLEILSSGFTHSSHEPWSKFKLETPPQNDAVSGVKRRAPSPGISRGRDENKKPKLGNFLGRPVDAGLNAAASKPVEESRAPSPVARQQSQLPMSKPLEEKKSLFGRSLPSKSTASFSQQLGAAGTAKPQASSKSPTAASRWGACR